MTTGLQLPDEIQRFILTTIHSVPELEALLLLRNESGMWNAGKLARRLYLSERAAFALLDELHRGGLLSREQESGHYRFDPASEEMRGLVDRLAPIYARHLIEVSTLIHSKNADSAQRDTATLTL